MLTGLIWSFPIALSVVISSVSSQAVDFFDPVVGGGSLLTNAGVVDDEGNILGEPLNVIISGLSSPEVLTDDGFLNFIRSLGFTTDCFNQTLGGPQSANLGDGNGSVNQTMELREDFGNPVFGSCLESLIGGNHLRVFRQDGADANSGALFLAVSKEQNIIESHTISPDGYDIGRDLLASNAISNGTTAFGGVTYSNSAQNITGLISPGSSGVNHGISIDGIVTILTVEII